MSRFYIVAMPRSASTSVFHWMRKAMCLGDQPFANGEYYTNRTERMEDIYDELYASNVQLVKLLNMDVAKLYEARGHYKPVILLPTSMKDVILKRAIARATNSWFGDELRRTIERAPFVGKVHVSEEDVMNMKFMYCDLVQFATKYPKQTFYQKFVVQDPNNNLLRPLGLPLLNTLAIESVYAAHTMDDREMLADPVTFDAYCSKHQVT